MACDMGILTPDLCILALKLMRMAQRLPFFDGGLRACATTHCAKPEVSG